VSWQECGQKWLWYFVEKKILIFKEAFKKPQNISGRTATLSADI
jgi:hypothetical protein